ETRRQRRGMGRRGGHAEHAVPPRVHAGGTAGGHGDRRRRLRGARRRQARERPRHDISRRTQAADGNVGRQRRRQQGQVARRRAMRAAIATLFVLVGLALAAQQAKSQWKTPWGDPDLQGTWSNQTLTPLERPRQFADKPVLTEAEAAAYEKQ